MSERLVHFYAVSRPQSVTLARLQGEREGLAYALGLLDDLAANPGPTALKRTRRVCETRMARVEREADLINRHKMTRLTEQAPS